MKIKTFKQFLFESGDEWIKQMRTNNNLQNSIQTLKDMVKKQNIKPKKAFQAQIYTKFGGGAIMVWSFAKNNSEAIKEIQSLPHFKQFAQRPIQVELNF